MKSELNLALCQMTSVDDVEANFQQIQQLIQQVPVEQNVDLFCFPENSLYMRLQEGEKIAGLHLSDPVFKKLVQIAEQRNAYLHLGACPLNVDGVLYNSSILVSPQGDVSSTYHKIHLFDIQLQGQAPVRESDVFRHGTDAQIIDVHGWRIGQTICYDLRFAELFSYYAKQECDLILIPAAFLRKTGEAHWEVLVRARAIESQAYVAASAQCGQHKGQGGGYRETFGHSLIVDPWGTLMVDLHEKPSVEVRSLSRERIQKVREQIPMRSHRRF